jgi:hypothetical protein
MPRISPLRIPGVKQPELLRMIRRVKADFADNQDIITICLGLQRALRRPCPNCAATRKRLNETNNRWRAKVRPFKDGLPDGTPPPAEQWTG